VSDARDRLARLFGPEVLSALDEWIDERLAADRSGGRPAEQEKVWFSIEEAADHLGVSRRSVERAIAGKRLASTTIDRRRLVHRDELDRFAKSGGRARSKRQPAPAPAAA
jgi:excisionase family DNA binding protein